MFEGLFQPVHLIILLIMILIVAGGMFLMFQLLWPLVRHRTRKEPQAPLRPRGRVSFIEVDVGG